MSGLTPQDGCDDLELADATVRAIAPSDAYPAHARRCGATFRAWCMCDRPLRGDEFTAAYVSEGSAANRRAREEQPFDFARTVFGADLTA